MGDIVGDYGPPRGYQGTYGTLAKKITSRLQGGYHKRRINYELEKKSMDYTRKCFAIQRPPKAKPARK
jgi:hypothetical protein